jgi:hypothetical protein
MIEVQKLEARAVKVDWFWQVSWQKPSDAI